jgi:hypothetical protein
MERRRRVDDEHLPRERVRHLIRRCARFPVSADCYDAAFRRLLGTADAVQAEWTRDRVRVPAGMLLAD